MKIHYNPRGLTVITGVLVVCIILNCTSLKSQSFNFCIGYTFGVISPYVLFSIGYLLYGLFRYKQIRFYTKWQVAIVLVLLQLSSMYSSRGDELFNAIKHSNKQITIAKVPFKQFLKSQGISMDLNDPNDFETFQPGNKYSNHYFNVVTDFPDNWEVDRGMSSYSIFRAIQPDSALSIALSAMPIDSENEGEGQFENPLERMDATANGNYRAYVLSQLEQNTSKQIYEFELSEAKIRTQNYLIYSYKYYETVDGVDIPGYSIGYQTVLWNVLYTIGYSCPLTFYDQNLIDDVLDRTNFIKPK
jgi:hypothetical protein